MFGSTSIHPGATFTYEAIHACNEGNEVVTHTVRQHPVVLRGYNPQRDAFVVGDLGGFTSFYITPTEFATAEPSDEPTAYVPSSASVDHWDSCQPLRDASLSRVVA